MRTGDEQVDVCIGNGINSIYEKGSRRYYLLSQMSAQPDGFHCMYYNFRKFKTILISR